MKRSRIACTALLLASSLLLGCSGAGGPGGGGGTSEGSLTIAITDAASDELASFEVGITSIRLTRPGGAVVAVLPAAVDVDLATLVETSQVLNILDVPAGTYTAAEVTIDFTGASCHLVGESTPAAILDSDGFVLTGERTFPIDVGNMLFAVANRHRIMELDFDLDQTVTVDAGANEVRIEPAFVMRVDPADPKDLFLPGTLVSVDEPASSFACDLRGLNGQLLARVTVEVDAQTVFQVDGEGLTGAAGLAALAAQGAGTWVQCYGAIHPFQGRIEASYVEAGLGTFGGGGDIVEGHIVERIGGAGASPQLVVLGYGTDAAHTSWLFNAEFTVTTSLDETSVVRRGTIQAFDTDDLNIGQLVRVYGTLAGTTMNADDAGSVIRMEPTRVLGYAVGPVADEALAIDITRVGLRYHDEFTWTDGGSTPADPNALDVAVGALGNGLGIEAGSAVVAQGFFTAVDDDGADFVASSLVNRDQGPSLMHIRDRWGGLTLSPTVMSDRIELAWSGVPGLFETAVIDKGFVGATLLPQDPVPTVVDAPGFSIFSIHDRDTHQTEVHLDFADFTGALGAKLAGGGVIFNFGALGVYTEETNTVSAGVVLVVID